MTELGNLFDSKLGIEATKIIKLKLLDKKMDQEHTKEMLK